MGRRTFSYTDYSVRSEEYLRSHRPVTEAAEQQAHNTGKLNPLVDPAGYGVVRPSRMRFEERPDGLFEVTIGTPVPVETRTDTTGSMGDNVNIAMRVLGDFYRLGSSVMPGCDLHVCNGIFGDVDDRFVLCRPQFEMDAGKITEQLSLMVPERAGNDFTEDPQYGIFGGAYLTDFYVNRIGLGSYDFTVSDADARDRLDETTLIRVFGPDVFDKLTENGFQISRHDLPTTGEIVQDLLRRAHAFFLHVLGDYRESDNERTTRYWTRVYGAERVITLPSTKLLPKVQATIIGLTEGTLALDDVPAFLMANNVDREDAAAILRSVSNVPIGAQAALPNYGRRPKQGDLFRSKTDCWPIGTDEPTGSSGSAYPTSEDVGPTWL